MTARLQDSGPFASRLRYVTSLRSLWPSCAIITAHGDFRQGLKRLSRHGVHRKRSHAPRDHRVFSCAVQAKTAGPLRNRRVRYCGPVLRSRRGCRSSNSGSAPKTVRSAIADRAFAHVEAVDAQTAGPLRKRRVRYCGPGLRSRRGSRCSNSGSAPKTVGSAIADRAFAHVEAVDNSESHSCGMSAH